MFSVVIPLYNKEKYILSSLHSVLNQTFKDFEVIIVNDGSTDNSVQVVEEIDDDRIKIIHQENQGVSAARNQGIEEAKYEWIAFLDADDTWEVSFLEEIAKTIENYPENSIFVGGQTEVFKSGSVRYSNEFIPTEGETGKVNFFEVISKYNSPIHSSNVVIRKQHLDVNELFPEGRKNYEDYDLWMRLCVNETVIYINKHLSSFIRDVAESASTGYFLANDLMLFMQTILNVEKQLSSEDKVFFQKFYNRFCINALLKNSAMYNNGERKKVIRSMSQILEGAYLFTAKTIIFLNLSKPFIFLNRLRKGRLKFLYENRANFKLDI